MNGVGWLLLFLESNFNRVTGIINIMHRKQGEKKKRKKKETTGQKTGGETKKKGRRKRNEKKQKGIRDK